MFDGCMPAQRHPRVNVERMLDGECDMNTSKSTTSAVRSAFARAQRHANDMAKPPLPFKSEIARRQRRQALALGLASVGIAAGAAIIVWAVDEPAPAASAEPAQSKLAIPESAVHSAGSADNSDHTQPRAAVSSPRNEPVAGRGGTPHSGVVLDLTNADPAQALSQLAALTSSVVHGDVTAAMGHARVNKQIRAATSVAAWRQMLEGFNYAVTCNDGRCQVWLMSAAASSPAAAKPAVVLPSQRQQPGSPPTGSGTDGGDVEPPVPPENLV